MHSVHIDPIVDFGRTSDLSIFSSPCPNLCPFLYCWGDNAGVSTIMIIISPFWWLFCTIACVYYLVTSSRGARNIHNMATFEPTFSPCPHMQCCRFCTESLRLFHVSRPSHYTCPPPHAGAPQWMSWVSFLLAAICCAAKEVDKTVLDVRESLSQNNREREHLLYDSHQ